MTIDLDGKLGVSPVSVALGKEGQAFQLGL